ncbi:MAG: Phenylacetate-coenzyme A ligase [Gammaproteobacteria bacterium]|nr:Phenylacetate-coenzyme A ligase [Gammaproteobacteria bacterium]
MSNEYFDSLETRDPADREQALLTKLTGLLQYAGENAKAYSGLLNEFDPRDVCTREALAHLPLVRKSELMEKQHQDRPFGGFAAAAQGDLGRVFGSPGPIYEPEPRVGNYWRMARALYAGGFRAGQLVHNTFSYHFTPAGSMMESGAHAIGCAVFPAGVGQTELQVQAIADLKPVGYAGTPSFLKIILEKAEELGADVSSLQHGLVSGEALPSNLRESIADTGIEVLQCYATADLGLIAYESEAREGMIVDEDIIVEIVRPGTGEPVQEGEVGEVVVTNFSRAYPLIRFGTGDLSAILPGTSPCGRTNMRITGWRGRADQTTKVKGMFVHPSQVNEVIKRFPEIVRARLVVENRDGRDMMTLRCETESTREGPVENIARVIREVCKLRGEVEFVQPGVLPNDGKVIDDARTYE